MECNSFRILKKYFRGALWTIMITAPEALIFSSALVKNLVRNHQIAILYDGGHSSSTEVQMRAQNFLHNTLQEKLVCYLRKLPAVC